MCSLFSISFLGPNSDLLAIWHFEQVQKEAGGSKVSSAFLDLFDLKARYLNNKNVWVTHLIYRLERTECRTFFEPLKKSPEKDPELIFHWFSVPPLYCFSIPFIHQWSPSESFGITDYEAAKIFHTASRVIPASLSATLSIILFLLIKCILLHNSF